MGDLERHYTDISTLPRSVILEHLSHSVYVSVHMAGGSASFQLALFIIAGIAAFMLMIGYRTRLATIVSWFLLASLHVRAGALLHSGDVLLRLLLFWGMFLPLGTYFSIDARHMAGTRPTQARSIASAALTIQLGLMYFCTALLKTGSTWQEGTALYYTFSIDFYAKQPFARQMLAQPELCELLSPMVWWFELIGPLLLLIPFFRGPVRMVVVAGFLAMHAAFWLGLEIGLFQWICLVAWLAMIPSWPWDRKRPPRRHRIARRSPLAELGAFAALVIVLLWNLATVHPSFKKPAIVRNLGLLLRLDQKWEMFAPDPMRDDGWYVIPGTLVNGSTVDLLTGQPVTWDKPDEISSTFGNQRRHKHMRSLWSKRYKTLRKPFAFYLCRTWNA